MKYTVPLLLISTATSLCLYANECDVLLMPLWDNLEKNNMIERDLGGAWILVGSITFHKKSKQAAKLAKINLEWHGDPIENLSGSLYKKIPEKEFMPIEDNLVCDGSWNKRHQRLVLDFNDRKQTLGPRNIFYLVFTVPESIESTLKNGYFSLTQTNLPDSLYKNNQDLKLDLAQATVPLSRSFITPVS